MTQTVELQCRCGTVRGAAVGITPNAVNHCVCYCHDCQAFAHFLKAGATVLDAHGGTDIFQTSPASVRISAGREQIACVRLTPKGLLRWYARCCNTPLVNTLPAHGIPFVGVIRACVCEPADAALGPVRAFAFRESARGDAATLPRGGLPPALMIARVLGKMLSWRIRGHHKRSPFFDPKTGQPICEPRVLTVGERDALHRETLA